ncbi:X-linked retinitis pigmentosa GTPase regulator [Stylophora pistillata]|uniref:X-linked retinitis pigmentosa GTPase regulator n=1 Tax=Stylophora pistillata TaxID=50429 RepID=A0A2B4T1B0_STYPI|nr:X-linked retinitis pigmentosa GTPase regulator [Stylophora pistillata]
MASDDEDVPDSGAVFTFGKSRFLDNKFWIRDDAVVHLACGDEHSAVVTENGKLYTFGSNDWGQLGHGSTVQFPNPKLVKRLKPEKVRLVAAGRNHTIVSTESGKLYSFGCGSDGQLGHGNCESSLVPKAIESLPDQQYALLSCGSDFTAAVTEEGQLYTWGSNSEGQIGHRDEIDDDSCLIPRKVKLRGKVVSVACGYYHMAVVTDDGSLFTCGENESGKLGLDESQTGDTSKVQKLFSINEEVVSVACGGNHTVAVTKSGKLYSFGQGDHGQLGHGSSLLECSTPKQVTSLRNIYVRFVSCGESHTAIVTKHGNLYTCGDGRHGKLGMGEESFSNQFKLEKVTRFDKFTVKTVACGGCHTLVAAVKTTENSDGTDSEAEAEKDILASSVSLTKSLQDVVDGPSLAATFPAGGTARNKRRQKNLESLGNSMGGSLPPINKSALPPLSRTLPALKKEVSKDEKMPVNPLDMSMLPQISNEVKKKRKDEDKIQGISGNKESKASKAAKKTRDAESSSGISGSEDEDEQQNKKKANKTTSHKQEKKGDDKKKSEDLEEEESDSEEEDSSDRKKATETKTQVETAANDDKKEKVPSSKEDDEDEESDEEDEESDEEGEERTDEAKKPDKSEQLKVVGKKVEVGIVEKKKEDDEEEEEEEEEEDEEEDESDEEEDDDEDDDDDEKDDEQEGPSKNKKHEKESDQKVDSKEKKKKADYKKKTETDEEREEEDDEEEDEDDEEEDEDDEEEDEDDEEGGGEEETEQDEDKVTKKGKNIVLVMVCYNTLTGTSSRF